MDGRNIFGCRTKKHIDWILSYGMYYTVGSLLSRGTGQGLGEGSKHLGRVLVVDASIKEVGRGMFALEAMSTNHSNVVYDIA